MFNWFRNTHAAPHAGKPVVDPAQFPREVIEALARSFDFVIERAANADIWFAVAPATKIIPIAGEGAGGIFAKLGGRDEIVFVDSEGTGGIVAPDLESLLQLVVNHPYWRDLLHYSGGGSLAEMRRALPFAEKSYHENWPKARALGAMMRQRLRLPPTTDMVEMLHRSVMNSPQYLTITAPDGSPLGSLFNRFTLEQNQAWRRQISGN